MTLDVWGLGLQAVNVLILIWLLSHVFWRPVAAAIAKRQDTARTIIETAKATQAKADAALAEATQARAGIEAERTKVMEAAREQAEAATRAILSEARTKADALLSAAKTTIAQDAEIARRANAARAADLALAIAARLLSQMNGPVVQSAFLARLEDAISRLAPADRAALVDSPNGIEIVTATDAAAERETIKKAVCDALGGNPEVRFLIDPDLIAGMELRSTHFTLLNSWQADLASVRKAVKDAA